MLQDYEIAHKENEKFHWIQFILLLIIIQSATLLFYEWNNEETIQFRILAHSNTLKDQLDKQKVQQKMMPMMEEIVRNSQSEEEIVDKIVAMESTIVQELQTVIPTKNITIENKNIIIPPKKLGLFIQPQARHHTILLTIGSGRGENWWCALFQNICFQEQEETEESKRTFFILEWIKSFFQ